MKLLSDYRFDDTLRYEGHKLVYSPEGEEYVFSGMTAAAVLAALLSVTDEGEARGIVLDTPQGRSDFFVRYEKEVIIDNGGLFDTEVQALSETYMEINGEVNILARLCRNDRLFDLAFGLVMDYMQYLVREHVEEQIYDFYPYEGPFAKWLLNAGYQETYRQRLLAINWTDMAQVYAFAQELSDNPFPVTTHPTFVFEGLSADRLLNGYWTWLWTSVQQDAAQYPDAKVRLAKYKQTILEKETHYKDLVPEIEDLTPDQLNQFNQWMEQWIDFVKHKIKPEKQINFWAKDVPEEKREALLDYIKIQERQPQRFKCLAVAVYTLRQLGYVTYSIAPSSIAKWLSERLMNDYSSGTGLYQFKRAWNELRRYHPAVEDEVARLAEFGVKSIK